MLNYSYIMEDKDLFKAGKDGNEEALALIYEKYYIPVFRYIYARTRSRELSEDLTQTVFYKFYKNIKSFEHKENVSPKAYFFIIAKRSIIDHFRKAGKEVDIEDDILQEISEKKGNIDMQSEKEIRDMVYRLLSLLPETMRDTLVLRYISDYTNKEISSIMGKTESNIRKIQSRALHKLRYYLERNNIV